MSTTSTINGENKNILLVTLESTVNEIKEDISLEELYERELEYFTKLEKDRNEFNKMHDPLNSYDMSILEMYSNLQNMEMRQIIKVSIIQNLIVRKLLKMI